MNGLPPRAVVAEAFGIVEKQLLLTGKSFLLSHAHGNCLKTRYCRGSAHTPVHHGSRPMDVWFRPHQRAPQCGPAALSNWLNLREIAGFIAGPET